MKAGAVLLGFVEAADHADLVTALRDRRVTALAMEKVPRISRAQAMDALSSQAALAGYYAPLLGAVHLPRILPMMTTAVGSLRAARVLVMGLGVAGLQALATAHRLGAVTSGYDVRPETAEQARSLGAKFVETGVDARGEGGYARPLTEEEQATVRDVLTRHIAEADRQVMLYVSLFTIGHSTTLLLGVLLNIGVDTHLIDAIIGLSVVYKGLDNVGAFRRLGVTIDPRAAVLVFGLFHGLGFGTELVAMSGSRDGLLINLVSFNIGVEIGQVIALVLIVALLNLWRDTPGFARGATVANLALVAAGLLLTGYQLTRYVAT